MRQGQQNRRGRGRSRKPQNPLARNYESNGPDVKIRGTASHVAEKYMSLARDALASGDSVTAESYLQHAEHYNRIIMAAHSQAGTSPQAGDQAQANGNGGRGRMDSDDSDDDDADDAPAESVSAPAEGRSRGRGRQRRNGAHASADNGSSEGDDAPESAGTPAARASKGPESESHGASEANGAEQPVDVSSAEESESASAP